MPTYVYKFTDTGETIEVQQSFTDATLTELAHPASGKVRPVKKVFTPVGVTFKGSGFFKTDNRGKSSAGDGAKSGGSDPSSGDKSSGDKSSGDRSSGDKSGGKSSGDTSSSKSGSDSGATSGTSSGSEAGSTKPKKSTAPATTSPAG